VAGLEFAFKREGGEKCKNLAFACKLDLPNYFGLLSFLIKIVIFEWI
jgi:hypothetical protein